MSEKTLSAQEIAQLRSSPYVAKIKRGMISFTPEFKTMAYERLEGGVPMRKIFEEHGIDPQIIGDVRIRTTHRAALPWLVLALGALLMPYPPSKPKAYTKDSSNFNPGQIKSVLDKGSTSKRQYAFAVALLTKAIRATWPCYVLPAFGRCEHTHGPCGYVLTCLDCLTAVRRQVARIRRTFSIFVCIPHGICEFFVLNTIKFNPYLIIRNHLQVMCKYQPLLCLFRIES